MLTSLRELGRRVGLLEESPRKCGKRVMRGKSLRLRRSFRAERLEDRLALSALGGINPNELVDTSLTPTELAASLVGPGVEVSNVSFNGGAGSTGSFTFADPTVLGFGQGIVLSSGNAADVVGPNLSDWNSTQFGGPNAIGGPGDADLDVLSGFTTYDAAVLEFDFVPTANQVVFMYTFASDEYPEWVNTPFNDVFAFYVNKTNYAAVRQVAGDPNAPFVPVAVNNINNGNPDYYPDFIPARPDLFRANYVDPTGGPSVIDLELDGITKVLTFQAPVNPGVPNHMKLAIADASDGIYDSAVFIQAGSLVSNENPVADLSLLPEFGQAPLTVTAIVEGEDPNGLPLTYSIDWGDGTFTTGALNSPSDESEKTTTADHTYTNGGDYIVKLTVSNGTASGTSTEDVDVLGTGSAALNTLIISKPSDPSNDSTPSFTFSSTQAGSTFEYSLDGGSFAACPSNLTLTSPLADGPHTIEVRATNAGVTDSTPASYTWTIDTTIIDANAPDTTIVGKPANPSNDSAPTFTFSSTDPEGEFEYSLDGLDWEGTNDVLTLSGLTDGDHILLVRSMDNSKNIDPTPASYTWTVDTVAPETTISEQPAELTSDNTPAFSFDSAEAEVIFTYSLDGGAFVPAKSGIPLGQLADGSHSFQVRATDAAGNIDLTPASYTWTIDTVAPEATIIDHPPALTNATTASFSFATEAGAILEYQLDNGGFVLGSGPVTFDALADGSHTFRVRANDAAGNIGPTASYTWSVDTVAPETTITGQPADPTSNTTANFTFSSSESGTFEYALDGGPFVPGNSGDTLGPLADGSHSFEVRATDAAGNTDPTPASYTWTIVTAPEQASASIVADPQNPGQSMLEVVGTSQDETIIIEPGPHQQIQVRDVHSGKLLGIFPEAEFQRIVAYGMDGNDTIVVAARVAKPAELHGDDGNDRLIGGSANDVLFGADGNDNLYGRAGDDTLHGGAGDDMLFGRAGDDVLDADTGHDVLVGGRGNDTLMGGSDSSLLIGGTGEDALLGSLAGDILIGGTTKHDRNEAALLSLLAEWKRTDLTYDQRIDHLTGKTAGGLNGSTLLKSKTVKHDRMIDSLAGGDGEDWFWALAMEVADRTPSERLN